MNSTSGKLFSTTELPIFLIFHTQPIQIDHIQNSSASEMRAIFQIFTFFVGEFVPKSGPVWKFVRTFVQILDLITASSIKSNHIQDVKSSGLISPHILRAIFQTKIETKTSIYGSLPHGFFF